jgi:hypothetical protein
VHACGAMTLRQARESPTPGGTHPKAARQRIRTWAPGGRGGLRRAGDCWPVMSGSLAIAAAGPGGAPLLRPGSGARLVRAAAARSSRARIVAVATRCKITLLRVAPTPSGVAGRCLPASRVACVLLGEADVRVEHREQGAREAGGRPPQRDRHDLTTVPPGPGNAPAAAWRYRAGSRTGRPGSPWQTHPYRHPRHVPPPAPIGQGRQPLLAREELTSSISSWATNTHPSGRPASHHGKGCGCPKLCRLMRPGRIRGGGRRACRVG